MARPDVNELRQLLGGDLLTGIQSDVLGHQGGEASRNDDGVVTCFDGAVPAYPILQFESIPALSPLPGQQLSGWARVQAPHKEEALAGDY